MAAFQFHFKLIQSNCVEEIKNQDIQWDNDEYPVLSLRKDLVNKFINSVSEILGNPRSGFFEGLYILGLQEELCIEYVIEEQICKEIVFRLDVRNDNSQIISKVHKFIEDNSLSIWFYEFGVQKKINLKSYKAILRKSSAMKYVNIPLEYLEKTLNNLLKEKSILLLV